MEINYKVLLPVPENSIIVMSKIISRMLETYVAYVRDNLIF